MTPEPTKLGRAGQNQLGTGGLENASEGALEGKKLLTPRTPIVETNSAGAAE